MDPVEARQTHTSQGERDLAGLAAELRFVDQAHLSRTVREHTGHTPRALRRLLAE